MTDYLQPPTATHLPAIIDPRVTSADMIHQVTLALEGTGCTPEQLSEWASDVVYRIIRDHGRCDIDDLDPDTFWMIVLACDPTT